jgi:hypothetical protein
MPDTNLRPRLVMPDKFNQLPELRCFFHFIFVSKKVLPGGFPLSPAPGSGPFMSPTIYLSESARWKAFSFPA